MNIILSIQMKKNFDKNYYNIANIVNKNLNKININSIVDDDLSQLYEYNLNYNFNNPLSELFLIIQSETISDTYKIKNNYHGFDSISNIDNIYYSIDNKINILKKIEIYINNDLLFNIFDYQYYDKLTHLKYHKSINNDLYIYSFSLFPEQFQPSGHIDLNSNVNLKIKLTFNPKFIDYLYNSVSKTDNLLVSLYTLFNKSFKIENGILIYK